PAVSRANLPRPHGSADRIDAILKQFTDREHREVARLVQARCEKTPEPADVRAELAARLAFHGLDHLRRPERPAQRVPVHREPSRCARRLVVRAAQALALARAGRLHGAAAALGRTLFAASAATRGSTPLLAASRAARNRFVAISAASTYS